MAPETMVAAVAQKTSWKKKFAQSTASKPDVANMPSVGRPIKPPSASSPLMSPKPSTRNATVPTQKSIRFFMMMLPAFFARVKPVSTMANPACMKNTSTAPTMYHRLSAPMNIATMSLLIISSLT